MMDSRLLRHISFNRKNFVFALVLVAMASCSELKFSGDESRDTKPVTKQGPKGAKINQVQGRAATPAPQQAVVQKPLAIKYRSVQDSPEVGRGYQNSRKLYDSGNKRDAMVEIKNYFVAHPDGQFADEAAFILAKQAFENNDAEGAADLYKKVIDFSPPSPLRGDATYLQALSLSQLGKRKEALAVLAKIEVREVTPEHRAKVFILWGKLASEDGRWLESTLAYIKGRKEINLPAPQKEIEDQITDLVDNRLNESELNFIVKEYPLEYPNGQVQLRLVSLKLAQGQRTEATAILEGVLATNPPGSPLYQRATQMMSRMKSLGDARVDRIGAILPLSGRQESVGRSIADGLQMGLANPGSSNEVEVVLGDVGPNEDTASKAFERLVFEEKVMALVGPPSGAQAEALAKKAGEYGIPYVATAARPGLVENGGPFVFRLALTPERQVRALVGYAKERLNARRFAILFPEDNFGKEFANEFFKAVKDFECEVSAAESYRVGATDFKDHIENMTGLGFTGFRKKEFDDGVKAIEDKEKRKVTHKEIEDMLPPIVDFDVIFIPESSKTLGQIAPALSTAFVNQHAPQLLGPSTWKNPDTLSRAGQYLENAYFVDAWSTERQSKTTKAFVEKYKAKKGAEPNVFAAQGFDIGMALKLAYGNSQPPSGRDELRARLEGLGSLDGALGIHNWDTRREVLNELQLYQIKHGAFVHQGGITIKAKD